MANVQKTKRTIQITKMNYGRNKELFCNNVLLLRKARNIGDTEIVNNYVYGILKRNKGENFDFVEIM